MIPPGLAFHGRLDDIEYICQTTTKNILAKKLAIISVRQIVNASRSRPNSHFKIPCMEIGRVMNARERIMKKDKVKLTGLRSIVGRMKQIQYMMSSEQHKQRLLRAVSFSCPRQRWTFGDCVLDMIFFQMSGHFPR